jgi:histidinol phosphatase-like enzyme (inositol monophosphatase family)
VAPHVYRNDARFSIVLFNRGGRSIIAAMSTSSEFVEFAVHLADLAGEQILPRFRVAIGLENKSKDGGFDPVTVADREAEAAIRREIRRAYPDHGILGEEHGFEAGASSYTWVIDPIDGTRAFVLGQLHWGTLIALNDGAAPVVGVMRQPYTGETFVGSKSGTELRRGSATTRLAARTSARLADVTVCATDPTMFAGPAHRQAFARLAPRARSVRFGGDCYTPCLVAAGCADLVVEAGLKPWDVQPLMPIVQGAGGVITDWSGGPADRAGEVIIAGNPELHAEVVAALAWRKP